MKRFSRLFQMLMILSAIIFIATGCSLWKSADTTGGPIDPPPEEMQRWADELTEADDGEVSLSDADGQTMAVTVYVLDPNGYVVPFGIDVPATEGIAREALKYMVRGGPVEALLPEGFAPLLPEGTEVLGMNIKPEKRAIVDFSESFTHYDPKWERKILEAVVYTLTDFDSIDEVQLWVNGRVLKEMPLLGTPLEEYVGRNIGINLESTDGLHLSRSTPVTVYFQGETIDHRSYLVPVTRLVPLTEDRGRASMEQLLKGPSSSTLLAPVALPDTRILKLSQQEDIVDVYFADPTLESGEALPASFLQSVVLSLTENTDASRVRIHIDGQTSVIGTDERDYSHPVTRPNRINALGI